MTTQEKNIKLIGYASGIAASTAGCAEGPRTIQKSDDFKTLTHKHSNFSWNSIIESSEDQTLDTLQNVKQNCTQLAQAVANVIKNKDFFTVLGGDHSAAIGTWSGAKAALKSDQTLGLIWIDAHLDSHTEETSETGNIHGMPLASLLGYGNPALTQILTNEPKLNPANVCVIGARSFERGESDLIEKLKIKVYFMDEINRRGLQVVMQEAIQQVATRADAFGVTIDVDSVDPLDAPGTGVSEPGGLSGAELCEALKLFANQSKLIGAEIVEFDPSQDIDQKTEKLVVNILKAVTLGL